MARTVRDSGIVVTQAFAVDLTAASADASMNMTCPGDGAQVLDWTLTSNVVGVGDGTHTVTLEHGRGAAGVAIGASIAFLAVTGATAGVVIGTADGVYLATTLQGTQLQLKNVESGTNITTGALVDVTVRWQL